MFLLNVSLWHRTRCRWLHAQRLIVVRCQSIFQLCEGDSWTQWIKRMCLYSVHYTRLESWQRQITKSSVKTTSINRLLLLQERSKNYSKMHNCRRVRVYVWFKCDFLLSLKSPIEYSAAYDCCWWCRCVVPDDIYLNLNLAVWVFFFSFFVFLPFTVDEINDCWLLATVCWSRAGFRMRSPIEWAGHLLTSVFLYLLQYDQTIYLFSYYCQSGFRIERRLGLVCDATIHAMQSWYVHQNIVCAVTSE